MWGSKACGLVALAGLVGFASPVCALDVRLIGKSGYAADVDANGLKISGSIGGSTTVGGALSSTAVQVCFSDATNCVIPSVNASGQINLAPMLSTIDSIAAVPSAATAGGATPYKLIAAGSTNSTSVKGSAGTLYSISITNTATSLRRVKFYDKATAPTCNSDTVVQSYEIPPASASGQLGGYEKEFTVGIAFALGIGFCTTTGQADNDNNAVTAGDLVINLGYK